MLAHRNVVSPAHIVTLEGTPISTPERTLVDLSRYTSLGELARVLDRALQLDLVSLGSMRHCLDSMSTVGRSKVSRIRLLLDERSPADARTESGLEHYVLRLMRRADFPEPLPQHPVELHGRRYRLDLAYVDAKVAVETDGSHPLLFDRLHE